MKKLFLGAAVLGALAFSAVPAVAAADAQPGPGIAETRLFDGRQIGRTPGLAIEGALAAAYNRASWAGFSRSQCSVVRTSYLPVSGGYDGSAVISCTRPGAKAAAVVVAETQNFHASDYGSDKKRAINNALDMARRHAAIAGYVPTAQCVTVHTDSAQISIGFWHANVVISCTR
ncbi:hypothetical protein [Allokutzneria albata]|uniref:Uncharacterized protein n=1 Tax=Allokutzneria albata TaxID=211114 RepID=A0A1H0BEU8_ALLAB|nr:hypothetical protein [Allokutzneria albata]SDN44141.1 hypothetical protein SAMN04489726_6631 [Allokutzneria albata]